jgi:PAS domain S-box-containing protein
VATNDRLLVANEEQSANNTELRRVSEELLVRQEEAQAAHEEAETLNEEMQATNEELETLNEEMQATVEELNTTNADLAVRGEELEKLTNTLEEQRQASEQEREQLALILASMQDAVMVVRPDGKLILTNAAYQQLFEKSGAVQFLNTSGKPLPEAQTPRARAAKGEKFSMLFKLKLEDQSLHWCEAVGHPVDSLYGGVVVIRDTTEREIAAKALLDSNLRTVNILESINDAFFALDQKATFTYINHTAEVTLGKGMDEILGKNIWEAFPELLKSNTFLHLPDALKERKSVRYETFSTVLDKWLEVKAYPAEGGGITVYLSDISQRKIEEKQRLESLGILAGGIAHDFNNLLAIISGNLGLIKLEVSEVDNQANILSLLNDLESATNRASGLTRQLLTFSSGGAPIKKILDLPLLLNELVKFALAGTTVEYHVDCDENLLPVEADEGQFSQVINNLVINAVHAMPPKGKIEVQAEDFTLAKVRKELPLPTGNYIKIAIKDYGSGIPPEIISRIFEPYFTTRPHGHGLGLAMAFSIVHRHGGHLAVESVVGVGTTFTIYLPAAKKQTKAVEIPASKASAEGKPSDNLRVLVLEDEKMMQKVLLKLLKKLGYEVEISEEGSDTVERYLKALKEEKPYAVLILDLGIPAGKGGLEVIQELSTLDPNVKGIVSSGYNSNPIVANYKDYGFSGVLSKPYTVEQLKQVLNDIL